MIDTKNIYGYVRGFHELGFDYSSIVKAYLFSLNGSVNKHSKRTVKNELEAGRVQDIEDAVQLINFLHFDTQVKQRAKERQNARTR